MADIPVPRSYQQILGSAIDAFLAKEGISNLRVGSPILSLLEAAAQSDFRSSADIFGLLNSISLDKATGLALERIGNDENTTKLQQSPATGTVTISDSSFVKTATKLYQGLSAPIAGSLTINVVDASAWPNTGALYIGRGTPNYEGALSYSSKSNAGSYWTITLTSPTVRFHNSSETVILSQGGNRTVGAGTLISTPQGNISNAVQFKVLYSVTIPDGETSITGVAVQSVLPGIIGNVPANAINQFTAPAFTGATVSNPSPFSNGIATEDDDTYRERIKDVRKTRVRGTPLAVTTAVTGITSPDENKRVTSASLVSANGSASTLYIDDGTGYEGITTGVPAETLMDSATGGEQYFYTKQRPVAKAEVTTNNTAPFALMDGSVLTVQVGGVEYVHNFDTDSFGSIASATAYEVSASINANPDLGFLSRTSGSGSTVTLFARDDNNDSIEVVPSTSNDSNVALNFPAGLNQTLLLYKNDRLLSKDGLYARIGSIPFSDWPEITGSPNMVMAVDGTSGTLYTFYDALFVNANTGYTTVGRNSLAAWAAVFNSQLAGVSATVSGDILVLSSNLGISARSSVFIEGGDFLNSIFIDYFANGADIDYTLDRNTGQIRLQTPLAAGDSLTIGSSSTRAFVESTPVATSTLAGPAHLWFVVDADAQVIPNYLTVGASLSFSLYNTYAWGHTLKITDLAGGSFAQVVVGDYVIIWDSVIPASLQGVRRVIECDISYVVVERRPTDIDTVTVTSTLPTLGIAFVRSPGGVIQDIPVPAASNYTANSFASAINTTLAGATATTFHTNKIRVNTNSFKTAGDIALVTQNASAAYLGMSPNSAIINPQEFVGTIETSGSDIGTPVFAECSVTTPGAGVAPIAESLVVSTLINEAGYTMVGLKDFDGTAPRYGNLKNFHTSIAQANTTLDTRNSGIQPWAISDRFYFASPFAIGPKDDLDILVDGDINKRFNLNMYRQLATVNNTYGQSNDFTDALATGSVTLQSTFGTSYDFNDCTVFMRARAAAFAATSTAVLFRYYRHGADGNLARVRFSNPSGPNVSTLVTSTMEESDYINIRVGLASGALRTPTVRSTSSIGTYTSSVAGGGVGTINYILNLSIASAQRLSTITTITPTLPGGVTNHGLVSGNIVYISSTSGSFLSGAYTILSATATTFTYQDSGADTGVIASIGSLSFDSNGLCTTTGSGIIASDFINVLNPLNIFPFQIAGFTGYVTAVTTGIVTATSGEFDSSGVSSTIIWTKLQNGSDFQVFSNSLQTISTITTAVNALAAATNSKCPITMTVVGAGTGIVDRSTTEFLSTTSVASAWYFFSDGVNYVKTTTIPVNPVLNYNLTFKNSINGTLATSADWSNETIYICPTTSKNVKDWLSAPTISGIFTSCLVDQSSAGTKVQLTSRTAGGAASIQAQGGLANAVLAPLVGGLRHSASLLGIVSIKKTDSDGLRGGMWLAIQNALTNQRANIFSSLTTLTSWAADGTITIGVGTFFNVNVFPTDTHLQFERQGNFMAISNFEGIIDMSAMLPGDFINISATVSPTTTPQVSSQNIGIYRIVRIDPFYRTFYIENPAGTDEVSQCSLSSYTGDSVMPGDTLLVNYPFWGVANQGVWTVESVGVSAGVPFVNSQKIKVSVATRTPVAHGVSGALGSSSNLIQIIEGTPCRFIMRINGIMPNQNDGTLVDLRLDQPVWSSTASAAVGSVATAIDKLGFPTGIAAGSDSYTYNNGLIGEANRVVYGDPSDTSTYPGVAAVGSQINITGPMVKRISISLSLRVRSGVANNDIANRVRSAVATVVNQSSVGSPISLSTIVAAASKVVGVISVSVVSPSYGVGNDQISLQPSEKALILNLATDIQISFVGV